MHSMKCGFPLRKKKIKESIAKIAVKFLALNIGENITNI